MDRMLIWMFCPCSAIIMSCRARQSDVRDLSNLGEVSVKQLYDGLEKCSPVRDARQARLAQTSMSIARTARTCGSPDSALAWPPSCSLPTQAKRRITAGMHWCSH